MVRKYFGTDGIRGRANGVITPELALKAGQAAGLVFRRGDHRHRVVIGKDTRLSGYMIETALVAGFTSVGMDVLLLGPMGGFAFTHDTAFKLTFGFLPTLDVTPKIIGIAASVAAGLGVVACLAPGLAVARLSVVKGLKTLD